jgi:hypothetical protein
VSDRAEGDEGDQQEIFPAGVLQGDKLTPSNVHQSIGSARNNATVWVAMTAAEVPIREGLLHPQHLTYILVQVEPLGTTDRYLMEKPDDGGLKRKIKGVKYVQNVRPVFAETMGKNAAELFRAAAVKALAEDAHAASKALDAIQEEFAKYMGSGQVAA